MNHFFSSSGVRVYVRIFGGCWGGGIGPLKKKREADRYRCVCSGDTGGKYAPSFYMLRRPEVSLIRQPRALRTETQRETNCVRIGQGRDVITGALPNKDGAT